MAEQLAAQGAHRLDGRAAPSRVVARTDPAVGVAHEDHLSGRGGAVIGARVPQPAVEEERVTRLGGDFQDFPLPGGDDKSRPVTILRPAAEDVADVDRQQGTGVTSLSVPQPGERLTGRGRVDLDVAVVDHDVPAEMAPDMGEDGGQVEELGELSVAQDAGRAHRAVRPQVALPARLRVQLVHRGLEPYPQRIAQCGLHQQVSIAPEGVEVGVADRGERGHGEGPPSPAAQWPAVTGVTWGGVDQVQRRAVFTPARSSPARP